MLHSSKMILLTWDGGKIWTIMVFYQTFYIQSSNTTVTILRNFDHKLRTINHPGKMVIINQWSMISTNWMPSNCIVNCAGLFWTVSSFIFYLKSYLNMDKEKFTPLKYTTMLSGHFFRTFKFQHCPTTILWCNLLKMRHCNYKNLNEANEVVVV